MITSFKGYGDDIFHVISNFHISRSKFGGKSYKLGRNCWTPNSLWGRFSQLQGPLVLGGARLPPSVNWSGGQDCRGKVEGRGLVKPCLSDTASKIYPFVYSLSDKTSQVKPLR